VAAANLSCASLRLARRHGSLVDVDTRHAAFGEQETQAGSSDRTATEMGGGPVRTVAATRKDSDRRRIRRIPPLIKDETSSLVVRNAPIA
jgi:hypothetical protein